MTDHITIAADKLAQETKDLLEWVEEYMHNDKCPTYDQLYPTRQALDAYNQARHRK